MWIKIDNDKWWDHHKKWQFFCASQWHELVLWMSGKMANNSNLFKNIKKRKLSIQL